MEDKKEPLRRKIRLSPFLENEVAKVAEITGESVQSVLSFSVFFGVRKILGGALSDPCQTPVRPQNENGTFFPQHDLTPVRPLSDPCQGPSLAGASIEPNKLGSYTENKKNIACDPPKEKKPTKKKNELDDAEKFSLQVIFDLWNSTVKSLAKVHGKNHSRLTAVKARQADGYDLAQVFAKVEASDFLTQRSPNERNWSANFDWVLRPHQCPRISEGQFDNTKKQNDHFDDSRFDPNRI